MDIHFILREYMDEIRNGALEDPDQSITAGGPQPDATTDGPTANPTATGTNQPTEEGTGGQQETSDQIMEN